MFILLYIVLLALVVGETPVEVNFLGISFPIPKIGDYKCQHTSVLGTHNYTSIERPEGFRGYYFYTPPTQVRALVLNLHHLSGDCEQFRRQSCIVTGADKNGWLVVTPCGLPGLFGLNSWNAGTCCQPNQKVDDYAFMEDIIARLRPSVDIPVYAAGYSNGAMLAEALMCRNIVTRAVSVSGVITGGEKALEACRSSYKRSDNARMGHVHGTSDLAVPYYRGLTSYLFDFPSIPDNMNTWAANLGCHGTKQTSHGPFDFIEWSDCENGGNVTLVRNNIGHGGHLWWELDDFSTSNFAIGMLED
ncbi:conserved hypothetical protein [Perkinsus marinus ATCC 50983]|uniref:Phospholipase/carboxylesterase/thioesterase domain-containing protein n=1 Tax=Perkinsus marinus (strain ATCC 50983 / TXsc) TaxID=423536 RepID=C5LNV6_PERM5|nr:conserved hypothetical protein [Perkinsus marinus ATCC 50983]EER01538.1 conserved hypothetical protein [Perkinsus marinus ATCC 50983]|eukprot:XP_002768820.1 conserved hypothetical protein [Perkinsus marinus ATCC 50983]